MYIETRQIYCCQLLDWLRKRLSQKTLGFYSRKREILSSFVGDGKHLLKPLIQVNMCTKFIHTVINEKV